MTIDMTKPERIAMTRRLRRAGPAGRLALAACTLAALGAAELAPLGPDVAVAQMGPQRRGGMGTPDMRGGSGMAARGGQVEAVLRMGERLELTEDQVARLDEVRREGVALRSEQMAELAELRSRLAAGQVRPSDVLAATERHRDASRAFAEERRAFLDGLLTQSQRETLEQVRAGARQARGNGAWRGPRGRAFGPRRGMPFRGSRAAPFGGRPWRGPFGGSR